MVLAVNLPFGLTDLVNNYIIGNFTIGFVNLNASRIPYKFNGKTSKGQFYFVTEVGLTMTVIICSVDDYTSLSIFADKGAIKDPKALGDFYV